MGRIIKILTLVLIFGFILTSCNFIGTDKFDNEAESKVYALQAMKEKYGIEFAITSSEYDSEVYDDLHKSLIGKMDSVDGQFQNITFQVLNRDGLKDDLPRKYFEEPLEQMTIECIEMQEIENLESYEISIYVHPTKDIWTGTETIDEFVAMENPRVEIVAHFGEGYYAEQYAQQIVDFMKILTTLDVEKELRPQVSDGSQITVIGFRNDWQTPNNNRIEVLTEYIQLAIRNMVRLNLPNPLSDSDYIFKIEYYTPRGVGDDDFWSVGETSESYMKRNNMYLEVSVFLHPNLSSEEYAKQTLEIVQELKFIEFRKNLIINVNLGNDFDIELGSFSYTDPYAQKTAEEIAEDYRVAIEAYERETDEVR